jgi:hypothetical protein
MMHKRSSKFRWYRSLILVPVIFLLIGYVNLPAKSADNFNAIEIPYEESKSFKDLGNDDFIEPYSDTIKALSVSTEIEDNIKYISQSKDVNSESMVHQEKRLIKGKVRDTESDEPIVGVIITIKDSRIGTSFF